jgi:hypothetical protein
MMIKLGGYPHINLHRNHFLRLRPYREGVLMDGGGKLNQQRPRNSQP